MKSTQQIILAFLFLYSAPELFSQSSSSDSASLMFPLQLGNEWFYGVFNDQYPGNHWSRQATIKVQSDTVMPNAKLYFQLPAMEDSYSNLVQSKIFFRKVGLQVYQYCPQDSNEYIRFDFAARIGDTLPAFTFDPFSGLPTNFPVSFLLSEIKSSYYFGSYRTTFNFTCSPGGSFSASYVADSIGIVQQTDHFGSLWVLNGARLNGKEYGTILAVHSKSLVTPAEFQLFQNYPNPFNPTTIIPFDLPHDEYIRLSLFDCLGRELAILSDGITKAGHYEIPLYASDLPSGVYFYRLNSRTHTSTKKFLLLK